VGASWDAESLPCWFALTSMNASSITEIPRLPLFKLKQLRPGRMKGANLQNLR